MREREERERESVCVCVCVYTSVQHSDLRHRATRECAIRVVASTVIIRREIHTLDELHMEQTTALPMLRYRFQTFARGVRVLRSH